MKELGKLRFTAGTHVNLIVDKEKRHTSGQVVSPKQRRTVLLATEQSTLGRRLVDHMVDLEASG